MMNDGFSEKKEKKIKSIGMRILIIDGLIVALALVLIFSFLGYLRHKLKAKASTFGYEILKADAVEGDHESVDFNVIHSAGSTATSWLYIPGTKVDYPLVQGPDNDYYLDRDAYGNHNDAGAIFINFANAADMSDAKTVIFGHNMSDGSMFTDLHQYSQKDYGNVHQDAYIYMDNGAVKHYKLRYYVFTQPLEPSIYVVSKTDVASEEAAAIKELATIVYSEHEGGSLICLSTCSMHKYRTVVVFEYVDNSKPIVGSKKYEESENTVGESSAPVPLDTTDDYEGAESGDN